MQHHRPHTISPTSIAPCSPWIPIPACSRRLLPPCWSAFPCVCWQIHRMGCCVWTRWGQEWWSRPNTQPTWMVWNWWCTRRDLNWWGPTLHIPSRSHIHNLLGHKVPAVICIPPTEQRTCWTGSQGRQTRPHGKSECSWTPKYRQGCGCLDAVPQYPIAGNWTLSCWASIWQGAAGPPANSQGTASNPPWMDVSGTWPGDRPCQA